jgi:hypothetical protein
MGSSANGYLRLGGKGDVVLNAGKSGDLYLGWDQGQNVKFGAGPTTPKMTLAPSGSLGIGTETPDASSRLDVNGNAIFRGDIGIGKAPDSSYRLDVNGNAVVRGAGGQGAVALQVNAGFAKFQYNNQDLPASDAGGGFVIGSNQSGGYWETNFYNVYPTDTAGGFDFSQTTHSGGRKKLLSIGGNGDLWVYGDLRLFLEGAFKLIREGHEYYAGDYLIISDEHLKSELKLIPSALDKVEKLRGVTYRWNDDALRHFTRDIETNISAGPDATAEENEKLRQAERQRRHQELAGTQVGVVAQDVEAVLPEAVATDDAGYKSVRYHGLVPLLIEAVKELESKVRDQSRELAAVKAQVAELEAAVRRNSAGR